MFHLPLVDSLWINLKSPDDSGEEFDAPWMPEDLLHICNIHTKLIAESSLHLKWDLSKTSVHGRNSLVRNGNLWKIWVLEESVIWFIVLFAKSLCHSSICIKSSSFSFNFFSFFEHPDMAAILILDGSLDILSTSNVFDFDTLTLRFLSNH